MNKPSNYTMRITHSDVFNFDEWYEGWINSPYKKWFEGIRREKRPEACPDSNPFLMGNGYFMIIEHEGMEK